MSGIKSLVKDTAVYGLSSIVGRFLNWCLVPLYVYLFPSEEYGIVTYLYGATAVALVILNYGMETGFSALPTRRKTLKVYIPHRSFLWVSRRCSLYCFSRCFCIRWPMS